jgi:hypothetical protein
MKTHRKTCRKTYRAFVVLALAWTFAVDDERAAAQQTCYWSGTAPVCDGECKEGQTERYRASTFDPRFQRLESTTPFGNACALGSKALCCNTPGFTCRWDGTAPFCAGECRAGETEVASPTGAPGASCWSGRKRYCCHSTGRLTTGQQTLQAAPPTKGVIYGVSPDRRLLWYRHDGRDDGSFRWAASEAKTVGVGWNVKEVFPGDDGVVYVVTPVVKATLPTGIGPSLGGRPASGGELLWYRHDGQADGAFKWAFSGGKKIGVGWGGFGRIFSGGGGVIYAVTETGDLMWYRHEGRSDGSFKWASPVGKKVGTGWGQFKQLFSGGGGVIYAVTGAGDLMWYRHDGRGDGAFKWASAEGKKVGTGWGSFTHVFSGGDDVIYAITATGDLMWYRHVGRNDGSFTWAFPEGRKVGVGWSTGAFEKVFAN